MASIFDAIMGGLPGQTEEEKRQALASGLLNAGAAMYEASQGQPGMGRPGLGGAFISGARGFGQGIDARQKMTLEQRDAEVKRQMQALQMQALQQAQAMQQKQLAAQERFAASPNDAAALASAYPELAAKAAYERMMLPLELQKAHALMENRKESGDPVAVIDPNSGEAVYVPSSQAFGFKPAANASDPFTKQTMKQYADLNAELAANEAVLPALEEVTKTALDLNKKAYEGGLFSGETKMAFGRKFGSDDRVAATTRLQGLMSGQALSALKTIFGGNPTEGEREILLKLQGSDPNMTTTERAALIQDAYDLARRRIETKRREIDYLRSSLPVGMVNRMTSTKQQSNTDKQAEALAVLGGGMQ